MGNGRQQRVITMWPQLMASLLGAHRRQQRGGGGRFSFSYFLATENSDRAIHFHFKLRREEESFSVTAALCPPFVCLCFSDRVVVVVVV